MLIGMNFIDGSWVPHRPEFSSLNPATEEELGCGGVCLACPITRTAGHKDAHEHRNPCRGMRGRASE